MEEQKKIERDLMSQEEFEKYMMMNSRLITFDAVRKFKSVKRTIRRGHVTPNGIVLTRKAKKLYQERYGRL